MTKTFDQICKGILGEMVTTPTAPTMAPGQPQKPAPAPGQPTSNQQQPNPELAKAFETLTKHANEVTKDPAHQEAIKALQTLLTVQQQKTAQQQNAATTNQQA